jgi:hypothetical protein
MTLYILTGMFDLEGEMVLGAYSTKEEAKAHMQEYIERNNDIVFDDYAIRVKVLDAPAAADV